MEKKLLFISHSAPKDNYLASWLASKLTLLGYEVWIDVNDLRSGSSFWNEIELTMRNESIRFLAIVSKDYIEKTRNKDSGVYAEIMLAKVISKTIENYILPIKVDDSSYDDFPIGVLPLNALDFSLNWGKGFKGLLFELEEQHIPLGTPKNNVLRQWYEYQKIQGEVIAREEIYGSNWFRFDMPESLYVHKLSNPIKDLYKVIKYPFVTNADYVIGFFNNHELDIDFSSSQEMSISKFAQEAIVQTRDGDEIRDAPQKLIALLNKSINDHFYHLDGFAAYKVSNDRRIFFPRLGSVKNGYVSLTSFGKRGRKLFSKSDDITWRFALSFAFQLQPFPHLVTNYHIVSSDENGLLNDDNQRLYRRSVPKDWFNRDWYERNLAFLFLASGFSKNHQIRVPISLNDFLTIEIIPVEFQTKTSYDEPK